MFPDVPARLGGPADGPGFDPLALFMDWRVIAMILFGVMLWFIRRALVARQAARLGGAPTETLRGRLDSALPPAIEIIAFAGQDRHAQSSGEALVMRTTPGLRLIAVGIGAACLWMLLGPFYGVWMPAGGITWAVAASVVVAVIGTFTFEARVDRDALTIIHFVHWRRVWLWRDLNALYDDGAYSWRLDFTSGRARLPKHLVGMPGFLSLVRAQLDRNADADARTARG
jgi:hypothetical protein